MRRSILFLALASSSLGGCFMVSTERSVCPPPDKQDVIEAKTLTSASGKVTIGSDYLVVTAQSSPTMPIVCTVTNVPMTTYVRGLIGVRARIECPLNTPSGGFRKLTLDLEGSYGTPEGVWKVAASLSTAMEGCETTALESKTTLVSSKGSVTFEPPRATSADFERTTHLSISLSGEPSSTCRLPRIEAELDLQHTAADFDAFHDVCGD